MLEQKFYKITITEVMAEEENVISEGKSVSHLFNEDFFVQSFEDIGEQVFDLVNDIDAKKIPF
jgi:hypothetical protein